MPIEYQIIVPLLPILGLIVGATIQYIFNKKLEGKKHLSNLRYQSYVDYVKAVAEYTRSSSENKDLSKIVDAKVRICIFGDQNVIKKLQNFEDSGAKTFSDEGRELFVGIISEMRRDVVGFISNDDVRVSIKKIIFS